MKKLLFKPTLDSEFCFAMMYRDVHNKNFTMGWIMLHDIKRQPLTPMIYTLEPPWLGNEREVSCIPIGVYILEPYTSANVNKWNRGKCFAIPQVPGRKYIRVHTLNRVDETRGCIGVGLRRDTEKGVILDSRKAYKILEKFVRPATALYIQSTVRQE